MKAYVMAVTNRDRNIFLPEYLSLGQLNDDIAVVTVDGKEQFFDPGQRYCPYGQLAWKHTMATGLRQVDGGSAIATAPGQSYKDSRTDRIADLTMDEHGVASGTVTVTYRGAPALRWRQVYLRGDATGLNHDLQESLERQLPGGMDVKITSVDSLEDYEQPLVVKATAKGAVGSPAGKRLLVAGDIFEVNTKPAFAQEKRELPVYFDYANSQLDAVRVTFPASMSLESVPAAEQLPFQKSALYSLKADSGANSITVHRNLLMGEMLFTLDQYSELRTFYNKFETKDQEPFVLKAGAAAAGGN
jgi:hypothetical protein